MFAALGGRVSRFEREAPSSGPEGCFRLRVSGLSMSALFLVPRIHLLGN